MLEGRQRQNDVPVVAGLQGLPGRIVRAVILQAGGKRVCRDVGLVAAVAGQRVEEPSAGRELGQRRLPQSAVAARHLAERDGHVIGRTPPGLRTVGVVGPEVRLLSGLKRVVVSAERAEVERDAHRDVVADDADGVVPVRQAGAVGVAVLHKTRELAAGTLDHGEVRTGGVGRVDAAVRVGGRVVGRTAVVDDSPLGRAAARENDAAEDDTNEKDPPHDDLLVLGC